jgi:hypothetical protein
MYIIYTAFEEFLLFCFFTTGSHYVAYAGLKLVILLPQPPKYWVLQASPPLTTLQNLFGVIRERLGFELMALCLSDK